MPSNGAKGLGKIRKKKTLMKIVSPFIQHVKQGMFSTVRRYISKQDYLKVMIYVATIPFLTTVLNIFEKYYHDWSKI